MTPNFLWIFTDFKENLCVFKAQIRLYEIDPTCGLGKKINYAMKYWGPEKRRRSPCLWELWVLGANTAWREPRWHFQGMQRILGGVSFESGSAVWDVVHQTGWGGGTENRRDKGRGGRRWPWRVGGLVWLEKVSPGVWNRIPRWMEEKTLAGWEGFMVGTGEAWKFFDQDSGSWGLGLGANTGHRVGRWVESRVWSPNIHSYHRQVLEFASHLLPLVDGTGPGHALLYRFICPLAVSRGSYVCTLEVPGG